MTYLQELFTQPIASMTILDLAAVFGLAMVVFFALLFIGAVVDHA